MTHRNSPRIAYCQSNRLFICCNRQKLHVQKINKYRSPWSETRYRTFATILTPLRSHFLLPLNTQNIPWALVVTFIQKCVSIAKVILCIEQPAFYNALHAVHFNKQRNNVFICWARVLWIPIYNYSYRKFIYVSILKPRR